MSHYVGFLRQRVGSARLLLPSVTALIRDSTGRLLLVRTVDSGEWTTPGGAIEPDESPADAVVRETWEETGYLVEPRRLAGVYGGPDFLVRYPNGDETQYVMAVFDCDVQGGASRPDGHETTEVRYWSASEAAHLPLTPWLRRVVSIFYEQDGALGFERPRWRPPRAAT
ncbi:MAG TPA: NUDIX domain-containing protein [Gemmatimonadaceae bacterium]|nr:NUDIX domain-containing protein [Gemmatimonadaceae bacterium]